MAARYVSEGAVSARARKPPTTRADRGRDTSEPFDTIVATVTELFARQGYNATGVAEIGRVVGLGAGALYYHIGSKEELLLTICRRHLENVLSSGAELLEKDISASEKLRGLAREHMRQVAYRNLELRVMVREMDSLTGQRKKDMQQLRDGVENIWNAVVQEGVESGELQSIDPLFVKAALGALNYAVFWFHTGGPASPEAAGDRIMDMLLPGQMPENQGAVSFERR